MHEQEDGRPQGATLLYDVLACFARCGEYSRVAPCGRPSRLLWGRPSIPIHPFRLI